MDILIPNMEMPKEDKHIIITAKGEVLDTDYRLISMPTESRAVALPKHGTLKDVDEISQKIISKKCRTDKERLNHIYDCILNAKVVLEANNE